MTEWPRAMPAIVTPFDERGALDTRAHRTNVETISRRGARGVVVAGSTGEGPYLEPGERGALVATGLAADPDIVVVCGINAETVRSAEAQIAEAADAGAHAALVITPTTLVRGRAPWVEAFYATVADRSPIPVMLYTVPPVTGWALPVEVVESLATHPGIVGMKDSGGDVGRLITLEAVLASGFVAYCGASRALADAAAAGAWGAITASANYALAEVSLAGRGDRAAQRRLGALTSVIEPYGVPGTKYAAGRCGLVVGTARAPLPELDGEAREAIDATLADHGLGT